MATLDSALYAKLSEVTSVTAVYNQVAPQNTVLPYLVFNVISERPQNTHDGFADLTRSRVQVSVFSAGYAAVQLIVDDILTALASKTYTVYFIMPEFPINFDGWPDVQSVFNVNELDIFEEATKIYHCPLDFLIWHSL